MRHCEYCKAREGTEHITVIVDAFGAQTQERFYAQFWLCAICVKVLGQLFLRDDGLKARVAAALLALAGKETAQGSSLTSPAQSSAS